MNSFRHVARVRYAESDQMGYAHHSAFVVWMEEARIEWLRAIGHSYRELEAGGVLMPVVEVHIAYKRPFRFDDRVELVTAAEVLGRSRIQFTSVFRLEGDEAVHAEGRVVIASVGRDGRPQRLPAGIVAVLAAGA
jgi:acyl-CoA thioester hydrolase